MKHFLTLLACLAWAGGWASQPYIGMQHNYVKMQFQEPDELEGYLTGVVAGYRHALPGFCGLCPEAEVRFEGYWNIVPLSGAPCQRSRVEEYLLWGRIGHRLDWCRWRLFPYIGVGYNFFGNTQDPDAAHLTYCYNKIFVPVGFMARYPLSRCWEVGIDFEWRPDVYARLNWIGHNFDIELENAFRVQLPLQFAFSWGWCGCPMVAITPYFDWNQFGEVKGRTALAVPFDVPDLWRWSLGLRVVLGMNF